MTMTEAGFEFHRRMENAPPWPGPPRVAPVLNLLHGRELVRLVSQYPMLGKLLIGEPGDVRPRAECASYEDGSAFVLVSGGILDFIDAVLGALASAANFTVHGEPTIPAAATPEAVDAALDAIYKSWGPRWRGERVAVAMASVPERTATVLAKLDEATRLFLVLHEVGHSVLHTGVAPAERTHAQELEADRFALDAAIDGFGNPRGKMRTVLAGAFLLPRVLEALRLLGHKFSDSHPPPAERLGALRARFRERCDGDFAYFYFTTVAISQDLRMEAAERRWLGLVPPQPVVTAESLVSTVMAMLIELANEPPSVTIELATSNLLDLCDDADPAELDRAAALARSVFSAGGTSWNGSGDRTPRIVGRYGELIAALPARLHAIFLEKQ